MAFVFKSISQTNTLPESIPTTQKVQGYTFGTLKQPEVIKKTPQLPPSPVKPIQQVTPPEPTFIDKTVGLIPKPILKSVSSDSPLFKGTLLGILGSIPSGFGKETDRYRKRFLDSASFGITGESDKALGKDVSYREGRSFGTDKLGATLDLASTLAGYTVPGLGLAKGAKAIKLGAKEIPKLAEGATKAQKLGRLGKIAGQQAKEGVAVGAAIGLAEVGVREAINPDDYSAKQNIQKIAFDTLSGAILDPLFYAGGKGLEKGLSKLFGKLKNQPEIQQTIQQVNDLKNVPEAKMEIKNLLKGIQTPEQLIQKINPNISRKLISKIEFKTTEKPKENFGYRSGTLKLNEISETSFQQSGDRGTGHFGTGHYFFGNKNLAKNFRPELNKPVTKIDLSNYKLFKPKTEELAFKLHDVLKKINNQSTSHFFDKKEPIDFKNIIKNLDEVLIKNDNRYLSSAEKENIKKILIAEKKRPLLSEINSEKQVEDSYSTDVMKMLGYDGIDVRGLKKLDNSEFGSVIYTNVQKIKEKPKTIITKTIPKQQIENLNKKILKSKTFKKLVKNKKLIYNEFSKKKQTIGDSTLQYPTSTKDVINPEFVQKQRYGQALYTVPKGTDYDSMELMNKDEIIRLSDILRKAKERFGIKYSTKNARKSVLKTAMGYYSHTGQIKTRAYDDLQTFFHELAHYFSYGKYDIYNKFKLYPDSFKNDLALESEKYIKNAGWQNEYKPGTRKYFEEGLSEFFRRYIMYPEFEAKDSPMYYKLIQDILDKTDKKVISELQADVRKFKEQNVMERASSEVSFEQNKKKSSFPTFSELLKNTSNIMENMYAKFVDEQRPIQKALEPYGQQGEKVFREARLMKGIGAKAKQWIENGITDDNGKIIFDSLKKILKPIEKNQEEFIIYLINKRAEDLIARGFDVGNKVSDSDRIYIIKNLEQKFPEFIVAQKKLVKWQEYVLNELVKSGVISAVDFAKMRKLNPNFVPFYRDIDLDELTPQQAKRYGTVSTIYRMKGSTREIINPLESIIKNTYSFLYIAEKNKFLRNFVGTLLDTKDPTVLSKTANLIEEVIVPVKPTKFNLREIKKVISGELEDEVYQVKEDERNRLLKLFSDLLDGKITPDEYQKLMNEVQDETDIKIRALEALQDNFNYSKATEIFRPNPSVVKNQGNVIAVSFPGFGKTTTKYYKIVSPDLYNAMVTADTRDLGFFMQALNIPTRIFRTGITSTFEFLFKNLFRDQFAYAINSKAGYVPYVDLIRGMFHIFGKTDVYNKFMTSGAEQSFRSSLDRNYLKEDLRKIIKQKSKLSFMNVIKNSEELILAVEKLSQFMETSSKIGDLAKGLKKLEASGKTDLEILKEAALDSRDLIDFSRRGSWGKNINAVSAFFNSAVQGLDKTVRVFSDPKTRNKALVKGITYITLPTITLYMANRNDPRYQELQDWDKDLFWHFWVGDTHFRLPIPFELGVMFKVIPERIMSTLDENDKPWSGFGKTVMNTFNFIPSNPSNGFGLTLLAPIAQAMSNTNYFGSKIVPMREQFLPPEEKFGYNTSESAKLIAKSVSKIPGYRDVKMLEILATPRYVDNIVQGYFGTLGQYGTQLLDALIKPSKTISKPTPELGSLPGFKAFLAPQVTNTKSFDEFYNELNRLREEYNTSLKNNTPFLERDKKNIYERAAKILQEFSKVERNVQEDKLLSPIQKRDKIIQIHKAEVNFLRQFLRKPLLNNYVPSKNN